MENNELTQKYELVIIIDVKLTKEEKDAALNEAIDIVTKGGGKVINSQVWLEKQKFTFQIKKHTEGTYYLIKLEAQGSSINRMRSNLKLKESILRFEFIKDI